MVAKFGAPTAEMEHQVRPRMHGRKLLHGDVPPDAQHGELALLIEQRVIAEQRQIDPRSQLTRIELTTSPCRIALTTSIPPVTWPKTVWTRSRCRCGRMADEELAATAVLAGVSHRQRAGDVLVHVDRDVSHLIVYPGPPVPARGLFGVLDSGSPPWIMKLLMTRWKRVPS